MVDISDQDPPIGLSIAWAAATAVHVKKIASYYYWHDKVGSGAPAPEPKLLEKVPAPAELPEKTITDFAFMDDDDDGVVKVYIPLAGDLEVLTKADVDLQVRSRWGEASMEARLRGQKAVHVLAAEKLAHDVIPEECVVKVLSKKGKAVLVLKKRGDPKMPWDGLRANVALPYRRGGGGPAR